MAAEPPPSSGPRDGGFLVNDAGAAALAGALEKNNILKKMDLYCEFRFIDFVLSDC